MFVLIIKKLISKIKLLENNISIDEKYISKIELKPSIGRKILSTVMKSELLDKNIYGMLIKIDVQN